MSEFCNEHGVMCKLGRDFEAHRDESRQDRKETWDAIKSKVSLTVFLFALTAMLGLFGTQYAMIRELGKEIRYVSDNVIEIRATLKARGAIAREAGRDESR